MSQGFSFISWEIHLMREEQKEMTKLITLCICVHAQSFSCVTLCNLIDCSPLDSAVHGLLQAKIVEWVAISSSRGSSWPRDQTHVSWTGRQILYHWATWESSRYAYKYGRILLMICISHFSCSVVSICDPMNHSTPGLPVHHHLPESTQTHVHWVGDAIQPSHPLLSPSPPALNLSSIRVFSNDSALCMRWPKYWSFSFNISPSNEHPGLISFRMDWLGLLAVQGTLKSLLQHHSSKASILQCSAFFIVQLSCP